MRLPHSFQGHDHPSAPNRKFNAEGPGLFAHAGLAPCGGVGACAVKFLSVSGGVNRLLPKPALFRCAACQGRSLTNGLLLAFAKRGEQVTALVFAPLIGSGPIKSQAIDFFKSRKPPRRIVHP